MTEITKTGAQWSAEETNTLLSIWSSSLVPEQQLLRAKQHPLLQPRAETLHATQHCPDTGTMSVEKFSHSGRLLPVAAKST